MVYRLERGTRIYLSSGCDLQPTISRTVALNKANNFSQVVALGGLQS